MEKYEVMHNCEIKLRGVGVSGGSGRRKDKVCVGSGAGFGGDRPSAALKLLQRVPQLDYLVLECLAERTLADRYRLMTSGGDGFDSRISDWMSLLLKPAVERGVCIITNMGAIDPLGAQEKVLDVAAGLGLSVVVAVASEHNTTLDQGFSTYLGAAPIVKCLEKYKPNVIITSRTADAALFLAPMVYELGWDWNDFNKLAQGTLAGHLLECGCQLTGGYFMHPGDKRRDLSFEQILDISLPFVEVCHDGSILVAKAENSGGLLNFDTCAQQLLYEIGDPSAYITPDTVVDFKDVTFHSVSKDKVLCSGAKPSIQKFPEKLLQLIPKAYGWKGWGEISYGGYGCLRRAEAADFLVRSWTEETISGLRDQIFSYIIGFDSLKIARMGCQDLRKEHVADVRLRMDGLFDLKEHAALFVKEFEALYTNGPAGGGGISTGIKEEIILEKKLVERASIFWFAVAKSNAASKSETVHGSYCSSVIPLRRSFQGSQPGFELISICNESTSATATADVLSKMPEPAPRGQKIPLYTVAHSRAGDKGNDMNFSIIPFFPPDLERLKVVVTPSWVKEVLSSLFYDSLNCDKFRKNTGCMSGQVEVEIYEVRGISSLNVVVRGILDGGVNCSRRIDRHGKTISDLILSQQIILSA